MTMSNLMSQIVISISEVMETMFYIPVEPREEETTVSEFSLSEAKDVQVATITFHGAFSGLISLIIPDNVLIMMTENFMGEDRDNLTYDHLEGTIKEALNMVAGNTFSKIDSETSFGLGVPQIISKTAVSKISGKMVVVDTMDGPIGIAVYLTK
ncbi:MAG: chemotaxis protein CheX [Desulfamplus sp.]|nr:chemotaxis protein CheX [Desulfamplus sp.]